MTQRILLVALVLAVLAPTSAAAQQRQVGAQAGGVKLLVADKGDELCLTLQRSWETGPSCVRPPRTPFSPEVQQSGRQDGPVVAGVVPASGATVEARHGRDARTRVSTTPGAYTGRHAAEVRFFAMALRGEAALLRYYDAGGRMIGASDESLDRFERPVRGPVILRRSAQSRPRWRLTASVLRELDPRPDQPDRMTRRLCTSVTVGNGTTTSCPVAADRPIRLAPELERGCGSSPRLLSAVVDARVHRVVVVLGSGRRLSVPTRALPSRLGFGARFVAVTLPRSEAVRHVLAQDDRGRALDRTDLLAAPAGVGCADDGSDGQLSFGLQAETGPTDASSDARDLAASTPSGGRLLLGDRGDDLCSAVVLGARRDAFCAGPPLDPGFPNHSVVRVGSRAVFAGVAHPEARPPELVLDDGARLRPSLQAPGAYAGRYAAHVRVFAVDIPAGRRAVRLITRDAAGRVVLSTSAPEHPARPAPSRSVLRRGTNGGALDLRARVETFAFSYEGHGSRSRVLCLTPQLRGRALTKDRDEGCLGPFSSRTVAGMAPCAQRRIVFYGTLGARDRGVDILMAGGRRIAVPAAPLPASMRFRARVFAIALPARAAVRAVLVRRAKSTLRLAAPLAPATRQCGYRLDFSGF